MKKIILLFLIFSFSQVSLWSQKPQKILGIAKEKKSKEYYQEQTDLWQKEISKNPKNAYAYYQKYRAKRSFLIKDQPHSWINNRKEVFDQLEPIIAEAKKNVGDSFEYNLLRGVNNPNGVDPKYLKIAHRIDPNRKEVLEDLLIHYIKVMDTPSTEKIAKKMVEVNYYSNASMNWNLNTFHSMEPNSIFISSGDMDGIPKWVLHHGSKIRTDIINTSMWLLADFKNYRKEMFKKMGVKEFSKTQKDFGSKTEYAYALMAHVMKNSSRKVYVSVGLQKNIFKKYGIEENIYLVGNALVYSKNDIDNEKLAVQNFEEKFQLDYIFNNFQEHRENEMVKATLNLSYLPGLMKVKHYFEKNNNTEKVEYYDSLVKKIAKDSGREAEVLSWFKK